MCTLTVLRSCTLCQGRTKARVRVREVSCLLADPGDSLQLQRVPVSLVRRNTCHTQSVHTADAEQVLACVQDERRVPEVPPQPPHSHSAPLHFLNRPFSPSRLPEWIKTGLKSVRVESPLPQGSAGMAITQTRWYSNTNAKSKQSGHWCNLTREGTSAGTARVLTRAIGAAWSGVWGNSGLTEDRRIG